MCGCVAAAEQVCSCIFRSPSSFVRRPGLERRCAQLCAGGVIRNALSEDARVTQPRNHPGRRVSFHLSPQAQALKGQVQARYREAARSYATAQQQQLRVKTNSRCFACAQGSCPNGCLPPCSFSRLAICASDFRLLSAKN